MKQLNARLPVQALVLLVASNWLAAAPRLIVPNDPEGDEVRAAARDFFLKIADGDLPAAKSLFTGPPDHQAALEAQVTFVNSFAKLAKSVADKFGKVPELPADLISARLRERAATQLKLPMFLNDDSACIAGGRIPDTGLDLQRVKGHWQVTHVAITPRDTAAARKFYAAYADACDETRAGIESGSLKTSDGAGKFLSAKTEDLLKAWARGQLDPASIGSPAPSPARPLVPNNGDLGDLIGKHLSDPAIDALFASMPGTPRIFGHRQFVRIASFEAGIELTFAVPSFRLNAIFLYGEGDADFSPFMGKLPSDLTLGEARIDVERKLGKPAHFFASSTVGIDYKRLGLFLVFTGKSGRDPRSRLTRLTIVEPKSAATLPATRPTHASPRLTFRLVVSENAQDTASAERATDPNAAQGSPPLLVSRTVLLDDSSVAIVRGAPPDPPRQGWGITLTMTPEGGRRLEEVTSTRVGQRLAIVLDGHVLTAPYIRGKISSDVMIDLGASITEIAARELIDELEYVIYSLREENAGK